MIMAKYVFPILLFLYPLLWMNQGIDVSDPMYSLTNFRFFPQMEGSWALATYLANVTGWLLMKLPFGGHAAGNEFLHKAYYQCHGSAFLLFPEGEDAGLDSFCGRNYGCQLLLVSHNDSV